MSAVGDALVELTERTMAARGIEYSPEAWDYVTAELLGGPDARRVTVVALSGSGEPTGWHAAYADTIGAHGFAPALCRRTLPVSVDHDTYGQPITTEAEPGTVSCLRCMGKLAALSV